MYGMYESVTQMLEELTWAPLSKRRENVRLILFYKIINNSAMVLHPFLEKADGCTQKKHSMKFRHIGYYNSTWILMDNRSFQKVLVCEIALLKKLQS